MSWISSKSNSKGLSVTIFKEIVLLNITIIKLTPSLVEVAKKKYKYAKIHALGFSNSRDFNDFYKKARENELSLYAIASENVPIAIYERLANGIEAKVVESIRAIVSSSVTSNPFL